MATTISAIFKAVSLEWLHEFAAEASGSQLATMTSVSWKINENGASAIFAP